MVGQMKNEITRICKEFKPRGSIIIFPSFLLHRIKKVTRERKKLSSLLVFRTIHGLIDNNNLEVRMDSYFTSNIYTCYIPN